VFSAFNKAGYTSAKFDVTYNETWNDFLGTRGYCHLLYLTMMMAAAGAATAAPVCSTWVAMSRHSTGRTLINPEGRVEQSCVFKANCMVVRLVILLWIWTSKGLWWVWRSSVEENA
jgi:hypothetical protein